MTRTEELHNNLKRARIAFVIGFAILLIPILTYVNATSFHSVERTITAGSVTQDTTGFIPKYKAQVHYDAGVFDGDYEIIITKSEYNKALTKNLIIKQVNYNYWHEQSTNHATLSIIPNLIVLTIYIGIAMLYIRKTNRQIETHQTKIELI